MPTYQYACTECGHGFEQFQSFSDDALTECPTCGGRLRKVFNSVGIVFKGSGFYRNDSRADAKGKGGASKDKESVASKDSSSEKSADKSSEAKSPDKSGGSDPKPSSSSSDKGGSTAPKPSPSSTAGSAA